MIDIVSIGTGEGADIGLFDTQTARAANILSVQFDSLEYAPDLGIDLAYFLSEDFIFENESFKAYLINVLAVNGINVSSVTETINTLYNNLVFNLVPSQENTGLVR